MIEKYKQDHKRVTEKENTEHTLCNSWRSEKPVIPRKAYKYYISCAPNEDD